MNTERIWQFEAVPLVGFGPVHLGMSRAEVRRLLPEPVVSFARWQAEPNSTEAFLENAFQANYDAQGQAEYLELSRGGPFTVTYKGVDVFGTPAADIVELFSRDAAQDQSNPEAGYSYFYPSLALSVWRDGLPGDAPDEPELGLYFDTLGLGRPGYDG